jgi:hypothetical protein
MEFLIIVAVAVVWVLLLHATARRRGAPSG